MPDISVPWGDDHLTLSLPQHWRLQQAVQPDLRPATDDWPERLGRALSPPGDENSLAKLLAARRNGRVSIILEDLTRYSPLKQILPVVLREIRHAGLEDGQLEIVFANGMHPPMTAENVADKLGDCCGEIAWRSNQYDGRDTHVPLGQISGVDLHVDRGVVEADLRIIISSVSPHLQAGFGGGFKMIFPGCAHMDTIRGLHRKGIGRKDRQLVGTDVTVNPMRRVIDAAGMRLDEFHGRSLAIQYLLDGQNVPTSIAAGEVIPTHRMVAKQCAVACGAIVSQPADILIANAFPRDFDLWQSFKCIANTRWAARPSGVIICLAHCEGGLHGMKIPWWPASPVWMRRIIRWLGPESLASLVLRLVPRLAGDAAFFVRMATQMLHRNPLLMVSPNLVDAGVKFPGVELFASVDEAIAEADALLGGGPQRVVVFPNGGVTFPVPTGPMMRAGR